jgi:predicted nucleotidyltransferase
MAQIKKEVKKALRDYLIKVQRDIPVNFAILYVSQAKGQARPHSDIDIAVFSHKFKKIALYCPGDVAEIFMGNKSRHPASRLSYRKIFFKKYIGFCLWDY